MHGTFSFSFGGENFDLNISSKRKSYYGYLNELFKGFNIEKGKNATKLDFFLESKETAVCFSKKDVKFITEYFNKTALKFPFLEDKNSSFRKVDNFLDNARNTRIREFIEEGSIKKRSLYLNSTEKSAFVFDVCSKKGILCVSKGSSFAKSLISIKNSIVLAQSVLLLHSGGLLLHGCGIFDKRSGYIFLGISGAGKSTIASLFGEEKVLSDDVLPVVTQGDQIRVFSSPFKQVGEACFMGNRHFSVKGLFFLIKDKKTVLQPVKKSEAMINILKNHVHYARLYSDKELGKMFSSVEKIVTHIPVFNMHFEKKCNVLKLIGGIKA